MKRQPTDRENICKQCNRHGLNLQNIKTAIVTKQKKKNNPIKKMGRRPK